MYLLGHKIIILLITKPLSQGLCYLRGQSKELLSRWYLRVSQYQGRIQNFLKEGASPVDMTDVQSQKSFEELPNMHATDNWVSWQGTTGLLTALIEYLTVLLEYLDHFAI